MSRDSAALNVDSVSALPNGTVIPDMSHALISSSPVPNIIPGGVLFTDAVLKETIPGIAGQAEQAGFGLGFNRPSGFGGAGMGSPRNSYNLQTQCNGIPVPSDDRQESDVPKRQTSGMNRGPAFAHNGPTGIDSNGQGISRGGGGGRGGRLADPRAFGEGGYSQKNDSRRVSSAEKRTNASEVQKPNIGEKKQSFKILQRPSSGTKSQGPGILELGAQDGDKSVLSTGQKKGRKKTLSLNPDELEDLEILIEQVVKGGIEETNTDSEDDEDALDSAAERIGSVDRKPSPETRKAPVVKGLDKLERETKTDLVKPSVIRNENGGKGRKFVKETGKNFGRARDTGKRRENMKPKDNRRSNDFPSRRTNEPVPIPAPSEDEKGKQNMTNVYPAQLKVALKHMDALPPRFQRRLQTGMSQISGSDPSLSKLMEDISSAEDRSASSSMSKDSGKSKEGYERGSRKTIRTLVNSLRLDDDESGTQTSESVARRLSFSSGVLGGEAGNMEHFNTVPEALNAGGFGSVQVSHPGILLDPNNSSKLPLNACDLFRMRPNAYQVKQMEKMQLMNGSYTGDPSNPDLPVDFKDFAQWQFNPPTTLVSMLNAKKSTFSVNDAPEFVSTMFSSNPNGNGELRGRAVAALQQDRATPLGFASDANQLLAAQPLQSHMIGYRGNHAQLDYPSVSGQPAQFPMMAANDNRTAGVSNLDPVLGPVMPSSGMLPRHQAMMNLNRMPYSTAQMMPYDASMRSYALPQQQQQQLMMPSLSNHSYMNTSVPQMMGTDGSAQMQWYGHGLYVNAAQSQVDGNLGSTVPYSSGRMGTDAAGVWQPKPFAHATLPFEIGRQRVIRLLSEGNFVMVILIGRVDSNKMSMFSELQSGMSGALVLNLRNGICPTSEEKVLELHQWNYKQALEAMETRKNPIIIDHTFAQQWQMQDYIGLAQMNNYHVEIIDCDEANQLRGVSGNMGSYIWDEWRPNVQSLSDDSVVAPGGLSRYNIPAAVNSTYYQPSVPFSSSLVVQEQQPLATADQPISLQNVMLPVPNV